MSAIIFNMRSRLNNKLAEWANSVVDARGEMSLRAIEAKTGVAYSTVKGLLEGRNVNAETIIRFAEAFHQSIPEALRLAGYEDIADVWEQGARKPDLLNEDGADHDPNRDEPPILALYHGLTDEDQDELTAIARLKWERRRREETTHGKKAE